MSLAALKGPAEVEAEILMSRTAFDGAFLVVEGDDDSRFFRSRVQDSTCEIVIAGGKLTVIRGMERLNDRKFRGALGIVDDDCDSIDGRSMLQPNLLSTSDFHDLDAFLIWSPALERVLAEHANTTSIKKLGGVGAVRNRLVEIALPFGVLRRWTYISKMGLDFKELSPLRFTTPKWDLDTAGLYGVAAQRLGYKHKDLIAAVDSLREADPRAICHGHDLITILAKGLEKGGILGSTKLRPNDISSALRLALDDLPWRASKLAQDIVGWEAMNPPFKVLWQHHPPQ